jgi:dCTP deaminase
VILSNVAIHAAIDAGDIVIEPEPLPRLRSLTNPNSPYDTTAVNLRLSNALSVADEKKPITFDLRTPGLASFLKGAYRPVTIDKGGGYTLQPNLFVLGNTIEVVKLPIKPDRPVYAARVEGRSSFARCGLLIHFTAPTIHAGFDGTITFEIMNLGPHPITLYPDMEICQLIFETVQGTPIRAESQFQGQRNPAGTVK